MRRIILLSMVLIVGLSLVSGCRGTPSAGGTIFGKVTEAGTGIPLQGAEVTAYSPEGLRLTSISDSSGNYSISNVPPGSYKVKAYLQGYHFNETMEEVQIEKGKKKVDFQLVIMGGGT